jgi:Berberine and berberine like
MSVVIESGPCDTARDARPAAPVSLARTAMLKQGDPGYDEARTVWNAMVDRTCTGGCAAAAGISAWWSSSSSGCTRSGRGRWPPSTRSAPSTPPRRCAAGATWPPTRRGRPRSPRPSATGRQRSASCGWATPRRGRRLAAQLDALDEPLTRHVAETSYLDLQRRDDTPQGHARRRYWKGHYLRALPDDAIDALLMRGENIPNVSLQAYGGAIADVPDHATAFSHRGTAFEYVAAASWTDPAEDQARMTAARRCAAAITPFAHGAYVNTLSDEGAEGVRRAYPAHKLARLVAVKDAYDPDNAFHLNQNIPPSQ